MPYAALFSSFSSLAVHPPPSIISQNSRSHRVVLPFRIPTGGSESLMHVLGCETVVAADFCDQSFLLFLLKSAWCLWSSGGMLAGKLVSVY